MTSVEIPKLSQLLGFLRLPKRPPGNISEESQEYIWRPYVCSIQQQVILLNLVNSDN